MNKPNWTIVKEYEDITYKKSDGVARIAFNRPEVRNAFRPKTVSELHEAFLDAREDTSIGVVLFSGEGPSPKDGGWAFCSGGDQRVRGHQGYVGDDGMHRLNILEVQRLIRFDMIPAVEKDLGVKIRRLKKLQRSRRLIKEEVTEEDIAAVVSRWTGIPVARMMEAEVEKLARMEEVLHEKVKGQDKAVKLVSDAIKRARAGISDPNRPIGSFLFLGPTGVGKTELSRALAQFMFNDPDALLRIDMSEFMEKHSVSKIIGSPPGYVGHDEGGGLTERVRHRPYSVILLDEVEKAHPEVFNILLQVLDSGHLTDAKGRKVNFKNTVIIMTSNIGAEHIDRMSTFGFADDHGEEAQYVQAKDKVMESLKQYFRPEFLNRLDEIITFDLLSEEVIAEIVELQVDDVIKRLEKKEIIMTLTKEVKEYLAKEGYDPKFGARPLKRIIQSKILTPVANMMVGEGMLQGGTVKVSLKKGELDFEIKKKARSRNGNNGNRKTPSKKKKEAVTA